jgi:cardiolipin synthase
MRTVTCLRFRHSLKFPLHQRGLLYRLYSSRSHRDYPARELRPLPPFFSRTFSTSPLRCTTNDPTNSQTPQKPTIRENIYTIPNLLTASRIFACPVLGWSILNGDHYLATGLLAYAGLTDLVRSICPLFLVSELSVYLSTLARLTVFWPGDSR